MCMGVNSNASHITWVGYGGHSLRTKEWAPYSSRWSFSVKFSIHSIDLRLEWLLFHVLHKYLLSSPLDIILWLSWSWALSIQTCTLLFNVPGLTCGGSIYPHIDALKSSSGIKYLTAEDSCCGTLRVTMEKYCSTNKWSTRRKPLTISPTSVVW